MSPQEFPALRFHVPADQSLRKSVQRLRWFRSTFEEQTEAATTRTAIKFDLDSRALTNCFLNWIREFELNKPAEPGLRSSYVGFAAGRMLRQLVIRNPLKATDKPEISDTELPEYFWPEGYVYVCYCLNVRQAVLKQDFAAEVETAPGFEDIRIWWSFRENIAENPDYAVPFLDLFAGRDPNWDSPAEFRRTLSAPAAPRISEGPMPPAIN